MQAGVANDVVLKVAEEHGLPVLELTPDPTEAGIFSLEWLARPLAVPGERIWGRRQDVCLVLHTSGTTNKPKIVPLTHENLCAGAQCISSTLQLRRDEICLNMMPLFHIHGLSINVLASLIAGATVIATPGFDPQSFFEWIDLLSPSWYSAVPTMHQKLLAIAESRVERGEPLRHSLRLIRNCSAALLPSVAERMRSVFQCTVMPTYAMTECMPIASNPRGTHTILRSVGASGGPEIRLLRNDGTPCGVGEEGEVPWLFLFRGNVMLAT